MILPNIPCLKLHSLLQGATELIQEGGKLRAIQTLLIVVNDASRH